MLDDGETFQFNAKYEHIAVIEERVAISLDYMHNQHVK